MKRKKAIFFVLFGSDLGCVCVGVFVCARACGGDDFFDEIMIKRELRVLRLLKMSER